MRIALAAFVDPSVSGWRGSVSGWRGRRAVSLFVGLLLAAPLALDARPAAAQPSLFAQFNNAPYYNFGSSATPVQIVSGPVPDQMNRGPSGMQWQATGAGFNFKLTIENGLSTPIGTVEGWLEQLPPAYLRAAQAVSDPGEDGIALYFDLDGAAGHGGKEYINVVDNAGVYVIAHEMGHTLEQVAAETAPTIQDLWRDAIAADSVSVSDYGNTVSWEDLAEFSALYAAVVNAGPSSVAQLRSASPERFHLWEAILYETDVHHAPADLSKTGGIGPEDWTLFIANHLTDLSGMSYYDAEARGDLDHDLDNDFDDFRLFQAAYVAANGPASFASLLAGVPEPSSVLLIFAGIGICIGSRLRRV